MPLPQLKNLFVSETVRGYFFQLATKSCKLEPRPKVAKLFCQWLGGSLICSDLFGKKRHPWVQRFDAEHRDETCLDSSFFAKRGESWNLPLRISIQLLHSIFRSICEPTYLLSYVPTYMSKYQDSKTCSLDYPSYFWDFLELFASRKITENLLQVYFI